MTIDPSRPHYFLHIPKTAGTTFKSILQQAFDPGQVCHADNLWELRKIDKFYLREQTLFMGHYGYGLEKILKRKLIYLTFLRDPVKRFVSHYHHIRRQSWHPFHQYTSTLESFVDNPVIQEHCANLQTRMIAATINMNLVAFFKEPALILLRKIEQQGRMKLRTDEAKLDFALERLADFQFIGIAEEFEESIKELGLTWNGDRLNAADLPIPSCEEDPQLESKVNQAIIRLNHMDILLVNQVLAYRRRTSQQNHADKASATALEKEKQSPRA